MIFKLYENERLDVYHKVSKEKKHFKIRKDNQFESFIIVFGLLKGRANIRNCLWDFYRSQTCLNRCELYDKAAKAPQTFLFFEGFSFENFWSPWLLFEMTDASRRMSCGYSLFQSVTHCFWWSRPFAKLIKHGLLAQHRTTQDWWGV